MKGTTKFCIIWGFLIVVLGCSIPRTIFVFGQTHLIQDDFVQIYLELDGKNILNATNKETAIEIHPSGEVYGLINISSKVNDTINVDSMVIGFIFLDNQIFSRDKVINTTIQPGTEITVHQTFTFQDVLDVEALDFVSGIYQLKYNIQYSIGNIQYNIESPHFYMKIIGNPLTSVTGLATTAAVAYAGLSTANLVNSMRKSIPLEVLHSVDNTFFQATKKLTGFYEGKFAKALQNEVSNSAATYSKAWKGGKCPSCEALWPVGDPSCPACSLSQEKAQEMYAKALEEKSLMVCKEVVDSANALSVYKIAEKVGTGIVPTTSIISVLLKSGLCIAAPRVGKSWNEKTRKLIVKSLSNAITAVLWIQAVGYDVISVSMLVMALLTATIPALIISKIIENIIKERSRLQWGSTIIVS